MTDVNSFFLKSSTQEVRLELIEISHSSFSKVYRVVRNNAYGVSVTIEDGSVQHFDFYPLIVDRGEETDDLDQTLQVTLGDLGDTLPVELDAVFRADNFKEYPMLKYRTYRSSDLSSPMEGPVIFQVDTITPAKTNAVLMCSAPSLNTSSTGEIYTFNRFTGLRGFN